MITGLGGPVLLVVAGGTVSQAAIARTAELAAGALVTVVGIGTSEISSTNAAARHLPPSSRQPVEPEQLRRTVALAMSVLEGTGVAAMGHVAVTCSPARAVARVARARGARVVILDQPGPSVPTMLRSAPPAVPGQRAVPQGAAGLAAELRRRMYGTGVVVLTSP